MSLIDNTGNSIEDLFREYMSRVNDTEAKVSTPNSEYPIRMLVSKKKDKEGKYEAIKSDPQNKGKLDDTCRVIHYQIPPSFCKSSIFYGIENYQHLFFSITDQTISNFFHQQKGFRDNFICIKIIQLRRGSNGTNDFFQKYATIKLENVNVLEANTEPRLQPDRTILNSFWVCYSRESRKHTLFDNNIPIGKIKYEKDYEIVQVRI